MNRPTGVIILAVLDWIGAACLLLIGLGLAVGLGVVGVSRMAEHSSGAPFLMALGAMGGVFLIVLAVIVGFVGVGLWSLKNWARVVTIVLAAIGIVAAVPALMFTGLHGSIFAGARIVALLIRLGINGLIIWYMLQPHVKQAFGAP